MQLTEQLLKRGWRVLAFTDAVQVNPKVDLNRGDNYPFVDMASLEPDRQSVFAETSRKFNGSGSRFQCGDTLMARITPSLENGKIARYCSECESNVGHGSTEFIVIRGRDGISHTDYAYYLTRWEKVRNYAVSQMTGTSGRQRVPTSSLEFLKVLIPPLNEQIKIAYFLSSLDNKIELNRRKSETLETTARTLFKDWFIDFGPTRAKAIGRETNLPTEILDLFPKSLDDLGPKENPEGWHVETLNKIAKFKNGLALQKFRPKRGEKRLPVVKITQLRSGKADGNEWASANIEPACIIDDGDIVFSWSASLLVDVWCGGRAALNQHLFKVTSELYPKWFVLYNIVRHLSDFRAIASGKATTMGHIKQEHLREANCVIPSASVMKMANSIIEPIFIKSVVARTESRILETVRDTLLPKLISGEIRIRDAERIVESVI